MKKETKKNVSYIFDVEKMIILPRVHIMVFSVGNLVKTLP